tara:strand:+ start:1367 stop:2242 length:876 start_codon:yes stop_codon:yes gene_type:complete
MNKNVLVIGGAGFIGSNLCEKLQENGMNVYSLDNYFTGTKKNHHKGIKYFVGNSNDINDINFKVKFSLIYHFGEYSRVEQSFEDIDKVFEFNNDSIYNVLKFAKIQKAKIVYSGSSTKFGDEGKNSFQSPYAWTKKTNSELVQIYSDWFNLKYCIVYFYNVYGANEISEGKYATVIAKYLSLYKSGKRKLPVVKPGNQLRNFTHIKDIISALILIGKKGFGDGYGIANDKQYSIVKIAELFGCTIEWLHPRKGNRMNAEVVSKKTKELGWKPKYNLEDYISKTLAEMNDKT